MSSPLLANLPSSLSSSERSYASSPRFNSCADQLQSLCLPIAKRLVTFSHAVDELLCGGIPIGEVTEICAMPGTGKSQLCLQLAVDVQIPSVCGGLAARALYIDCDGSFNANRCADIAQACVSHLKETALSEGDLEMVKSVESLTIESVLGGVLVQHCQCYAHLLAMLQQIPYLLQTEQNVKLLVIDSLASLFRHSLTDYSLRSRLLNHVMQSLAQVADDHQVAVVVTNQIVTRFGKSRQDVASFSPALGDSWGHAATLRLLIEMDAECSNSHTRNVAFGILVCEKLRLVDM